MSPEAEDLIRAANIAAASPAAKLSGIASALRLLVSWVMSIEVRLRKVENHVRP